MHSRVRLKIPPEAGVRSDRVVTIIVEMYDGTDL
jgi:hypothetical protein